MHGLYREAFALSCFTWVGILPVFSTQLHRLRCLHPYNARRYVEPLLSPDNTLIFLFHLHCHLLIHPEVMLPVPWSTYSCTSAGVKMSFLFHRKQLKARCRELCPELSALNEFVAQRAQSFSELNNSDSDHFCCSLSL